MAIVAPGASSGSIRICTCGLVQQQKAGTKVHEGVTYCNRCGKPTEVPADVLAAVAPSAAASPREAKPMTQERLFVTVVGAIVAAALIIGVPTALIVNHQHQVAQQKRERQELVNAVFAECVAHPDAAICQP